MSLKVPYGASLVIQDELALRLLEGGSLHAYKNNYTPINGSVLASFTEADFSGYAAITVVGWTAAALDASNKASVEAAIQTWTRAAGATSNTVYGIYFRSPAGDLLYAERDPAGGFLLDTEGQFYSYLPRFTYRSEF